MAAILCIIMFICCLLGLLLFHCSPLLCIIGTAASAILFTFDLFLFKEAKFKRILTPILTCVLIALCLFIPISPTGYGYYDYLNMLENFGNAELSDKSDKAQKKLDELTERYGETDDVLYVLALKAIERSAPDEAESLAGKFSDKTTENYYTVMEQAIAKKHEYSEDLGDQLITLFEKAVNDNPNWKHANESLGMLLLDKKEYEKATYYLLKAYELSEKPDGKLSYYLGVALIEQGKNSEALALFEQATSIGVDDECLADIAWYVDQIIANTETEAE